jgi:NitT/TauT family transport system substrate-binding protein
MKRAVRFGIASLAVAAVGGALVAHQTSAQSMTEVSFILNWFVEPPHGGYYAAMKDGLYEKAGLKVKLIPGGPDVAGQTLLAAGKVQFAESDPPAILNARAEGAPLVGVFATFQDSPQAFLYHKSNPVKSFADFKGRTVEVSPGAPYWDFIEAKYKLKDNYKRINYGGQVGPFVQDKTRLTQCYAIAEPFDLEKQKVDFGVLLVADSGFDPYVTIATTEDYIKSNGPTVKAFVAATQEGWKRYLKNPAAYEDALQAGNKDLKPDYMKWGAKQVGRYVLGTDGVTTKNSIGYMTDERWKAMADQLLQVGVLKKAADWKAAFTSEFIPKP